MSVHGEKPCPSAGTYLSATGDLLVSADNTDEPERLALVTAASHHPAAHDCGCGCALGYPSDQVRTVSHHPAHGEVTTTDTPTAALAPIAGELTADQWATVRDLTTAALAHAAKQHQTIQRASEIQRQRAENAEAKITAMRAYAIEKHQDGDICRDGLNEFLDAHDLDPYAPSYQARVNVSALVTVTCNEKENSGHLFDIIESYLTVETDNPDRLIIEHWEIPGSESLSDVARASRHQQQHPPGGGHSGRRNRASDQRPVPAATSGGTNRSAIRPHYNQFRPTD